MNDFGYNPFSSQSYNWMQVPEMTYIITHDISAIFRQGFLPEYSRFNKASQTLDQIARGYVYLGPNGNYENTMGRGDASPDD